MKFLQKSEKINEKIKPNVIHFQNIDSTVIFFISN